MDKERKATIRAMVENYNTQLDAIEGQLDLNLEAYLKNLELEKDELEFGLSIGQRDDMLHSLNNLFRYIVLARDGDIGKVHDFLIDDHTWVIRYLVVDVDIIGRRVLISPIAIDQIDSSQRNLSITLTRYEVKYSPDIDFDQPISRQQQTKLHEHYGWPLYWLDKITPDLRNLGLHPHTLVRIIAGPDTESEKFPHDDTIDPSMLVDSITRAAVPAESAAATEAYNGNPNLRSAKELMGYGIQARDGTVGHVEDFFIGDNDWSIQLVVINTRNWLPGNKVLLAPSWIDLVRWSEAKVHVGLNRKTIENCPEYNPLPNKSPA